MSKGSRWQPPHPDPAKMRRPRRRRHDFVQDTPWSPAKSVAAMEAAEKQPGVFGGRCIWPECIDYVDPFYEVHLCAEHAHHVRKSINDYEDRAERRIAEYTAEIAERKAATAEKIDAGIKPSEGDLIPGWVYYIELDGLIKIGFSKNVTQRMRQYPPTARLLAVEPGTKRVERERHQHFGAHLSRGREWFHDVPELREWVDTVVAEYGDAGHLAHKWGRSRPQVVAGKRIRNRRW